MKQRIITGIIVVLIMIPILLFAQTPVLPIAIAVGSVIAMFEIMRCIGMQKAYAFAVPLYALAAVMPFLSRYMSLGSLNATFTPESNKHLAQNGAILMIIILLLRLKKMNTKKQAVRRPAYKTDRATVRPSAHKR